ncbi:hypothetical protein ACQI4L_19555 [Mycolicibacterium litorale]|uniref:hypothetical protein n=1 Tax=Mycolicibacterium litorale TaxID=758802 RepID=UPI003CEC9267
MAVPGDPPQATVSCTAGKYSIIQIMAGRHPMMSLPCLIASPHTDLLSRDPEALLSDLVFFRGELSSAAGSVTVTEGRPGSKN